MRVPSFERYAHRLQGLALLLCGMIIGAAIFMSITHHQLDFVIKKERQLQEQLSILLEDNESLKNYQNKQSVIKSVQVAVEQSLENELDDVIISEIKKRVSADLKSLKGRPITSIDQDPQQIRQLYGARVLPNIHNKDYLVEISTMIVIYGDLKVWVSAREYIRQPS